MFFKIVFFNFHFSISIISLNRMSFSLLTKIRFSVDEMSAASDRMKCFSVFQCIFHFEIRLFTTNQTGGQWGQRCELQKYLLVTALDYVTCMFQKKTTHVISITPPDEESSTKIIIRLLGSIFQSITETGTTGLHIIPSKRPRFRGGISFMFL